MRLDITRKSDLAIRVIATLRRDGERMSGRHLASRIGTTTTFLAQVVAPLVQRGWVVSQPGRLGGYELVADASAISVLDVIEAVEGPTDTAACVLRDERCSEAEPCATHVAWARARTALLNELAATPLDVLSPQGVKR